MSRNRQPRLPSGAGPHRPPLCCANCGTKSQLFISSLAPPSPGSNAVAVFFTCTSCGLSSRSLADAAQFTGALNRNPGSTDLLVFSGQYIHCGQSMQRTATGVLRFDGRIIEDEFRGVPDVCLDVKVLECPCGFRLVLPE